MKSQRRLFSRAEISMTGGHGWRMPISFWGAEAAIQMAELSGAVQFAQVHHSGELRLGMYAPKGEDPQQPHVQDELHFVVSGSGQFIHEARNSSFKPGDATFVPAGVDTTALRTLARTLPPGSCSGARIAAHP